MRPQEEKHAETLRAIGHDIQSSLTKIRRIEEESSPYTCSSFVNSIVGKVERLAANGQAAFVEKALRPGH